jgi:hypothetical protein
LVDVENCGHRHNINCLQDSNQGSINEIEVW